MVKTQECHKFDRLWNERLDFRDRRSPERDRFLVDHASRCEHCRSRDLVYTDLAALQRRPVLVSNPSVEAINRWQSALAIAATTALIPSDQAPVAVLTPVQPRRRLTRFAVRAGTAALAAAVILLVGRAMLPILFPVEPIPPTRFGASATATPLEEAFNEASAMTQEIAREIAAPGRRPQVTPSTPNSQSPKLVARPFSFVPAESSPSGPATTVPSSHSEAVGLSPDQNRRAFRFLGGGRGSDEIADPDLDLVEGQ